jgi:hypothetical protein
LTLGRFACEKAFGAAPGALAPSSLAAATGKAVVARDKKAALECLSGVGVFVKG